MASIMADVDSTANFEVLKNGRDFSRLLYPNPVCFLTSRRHDQHGWNVMTISWLTPVNNDGLVALSMNKGRYSYECLRACPFFVLSVPVSGMESLVLNVGKCSGRRGDKLTFLKDQGLSVFKLAARSENIAGAVDSHTKIKKSFASLASTDSESGGESDAPGEFRASVSQDSDSGDVAVVGTVAWLQLTVESMQDIDGQHAMIIARVKNAAVRPDYWNGKNFASRVGGPPILTFLGSQAFGYTQSYAETKSGRSAQEEGSHKKSPRLD